MNTLINRYFITEYVKGHLRSVEYMKDCEHLQITIHKEFCTDPSCNLEIEDLDMNIPIVISE
jgi:hypothetical protein